MSENKELSEKQNDCMTKEAEVCDIQSESIQTEDSADKKQADDVHCLDEDFWDGLTLPEVTTKQSGSRKWFVLVIVVGAAMLTCGFSIAITTLRGQGWLSNYFVGNQKMEFTLPVSEKPELDDSMLESDGRYTTEGLAEAAMPSICEINVYTSESSLIPGGQGSGIIISDTGYIVTNAHVVSDAEYGIRVTLDDKSEYAATLVGLDYNSDLAVIKIPAEKLTPAQFGDSSKTIVGEDIVAIGSGAGYFNTVTSGIVSGINRKIHVNSTASTMNCIQIDAPINPGNSGGALFNMWGQVIGVTTSKLSASSYENVGFAISVADAKPVIEELMENGRVTGKAKIGITYYRVTETAAEINDAVAGICVVKIDESCDVAKTELQENDIITEIDGVDVTKFEDISEIISGKGAGDEITCKVTRINEDDKSTKNFEISFKLMEDNGGLVMESDSGAAQ